MLISFKQNYYRQNDQGFEEFLSGIEKKKEYIILYFTTTCNSGWQRVFKINGDDLIHMCDVDEGNQWHVFNATDEDVEKIKREVFEEEI